jgi:hypothetical protein
MKAYQAAGGRAAPCPAAAHGSQRETWPGRALPVPGASPEQPVLSPALQSQQTRRAALLWACGARCAAVEMQINSERGHSRQQEQKTRKSGNREVER